MNEEERKYYFMRTHLGMSPDEIYRETNIAEVGEIPSLIATSLTYEKTYEEEMAEKKSVQLAEDFLRKLEITVKTNYGYYRDTYSILKDIGDAIIRSDT